MTDLRCTSCISTTAMVRSADSPVCYWCGSPMHVWGPSVLTPSVGALVDELRARLARATTMPVAILFGRVP